MNSGKPVIDIWRALTFIAAIAGVAWVATVFLQAVGHGAVDAELRHKVLESDDPVVDAYRAEQATLLEQSRWIDRDAGTVQLPIERAMELVIEEQPGEESR